MKTLERCFKEKTDKEMSHVVDKVEDTIQNATLTAIDRIVARKIELAIRSKNASSGQYATSVTANSEREEHIKVTVLFENASENKNVLHISNMNDETRNDIPDEVSEFSVPETRFERQTHTQYIETGQTAERNQISEFLTGRILTPRKPPSYQH